MKKIKYIILLLTCILICACNSIKSVSIRTIASPDIFIECKLSEDIIVENRIENNDGIFAQVRIDGEDITVLLKSKFLRQIYNEEGAYKVIFINNLNENIFKEYSSNNSDLIDGLISLIDRIFIEINVFTFGGNDNNEIKIYDKNYFIKKSNIYIEKRLFGNRIEYKINF